MAISYAWSFPTLDVVYNEDNLQNVAQTVHWVYTATEGNYTASTYSTVSLPPPAPEDFIPYDELTEAIVQGWVEGALGAEQVAAMNDALAANIANQQNPTGGALPPPWTQPQE